MTFVDSEGVIFSRWERRSCRDAYARGEFLFEIDGEGPVKGVEAPGAIELCFSLNVNASENPGMGPDQSGLAPNRTRDSEIRPKSR